MPDFTADTPPIESTPESAAAFNSNLNPGLGQALGAALQDGPVAAISRAAQRGQNPDASWFDRALNATPVGQLATRLAGSPAPAPDAQTMLSAEDANSQYAPQGTTIASGPMSKGLAQLVGQQKQAELDRNNVWGRFANAHSWPTNFAAGTAGFMLDPLNVGSLFVPGLGEESILSGLVRGGVESGVGARVAARMASGTTAATVGQVPLVGLKYGLGREQDSDYGLRSAFSDLAFAVVAGAVHGVLGSALHETGVLSPDKLMQSEALRSANAQDTHAALNAAISQVATERPVDVSPIFDIGTAQKAAANGPVLDAALQDAKIDPRNVNGPVRGRVLSIMDRDPEVHPLDAYQQAVGELLTERLFHRTRAEPFEEFDINAPRSEYSFAHGGGIYFSKDADDPTTHIFGRNIVSADVAIKNPAPVVTFRNSLGPYSRVAVPVSDWGKIQAAADEGTTGLNNSAFRIADLSDPDAWRMWKPGDDFEAWGRAVKKAAANGTLRYVTDFEKLTKTGADIVRAAGYDGVKWEGSPDEPGKPAQTVIFDPKQAQIVGFGHEPVLRGNANDEASRQGIQPLSEMEQRAGALEDGRSAEPDGRPAEPRLSQPAAGGVGAEPRGREGAQSSGTGADGGSTAGPGDRGNPAPAIEARSPAELREALAEQERNGYSTGIPQSDFDATRESLYGADVEEAKPPTPEAQDAETTALEQQIAAHPGLTDADRAAIQAANQDVENASLREQAYAQAGECLTGAGI